MATGENADEIRNFYGYTLAVALRRNGHEMHACSQMGNRHQVAVTDVPGDLPGFKNSLHGNLARGLNAKRGRIDAFWGGDRSFDTTPSDDEEWLEDLVCLDTSHVEAGLVTDGEQWPGVTTYGWRFGETRTFQRPSWYYDPKRPENPRVVRVTRVRPNIMTHLTDDELFELLMEKCRRRVHVLREQMSRDGRRFIGVEQLKKDRWNRVARSFGHTERRRSDGSIDRLRARARAKTRRTRDWERRYAKARGELLSGGAPVFPYGTYYLHRHAGVRVAHAPP
jgi:hypothetical protein